MPARQIGLARSAWTGDQHADLLIDKAAGRQIVNDSTIGIRQAVEVESFQCLLPTEVRAAHAGVELTMIAPCDLVLDEQRQEVGIGELTVDGFTVARFERVQEPDSRNLLAPIRRKRFRLLNGESSHDYPFARFNQ